MSRCGECKLGCNEIGVFYCEENLGYEQCIDRLQDALYSADRPQGEWIRTFDGNEWYWYCSNCKEQWYEEDLWMGGNEFPHFCPNCGARMKGADDDSKRD